MNEDALRDAAAQDPIVQSKVLLMAAEFAMRQAEEEGRPPQLNLTYLKTNGWLQTLAASIRGGTNLSLLGKP